MNLQEILMVLLLINAGFSLIASICCALAGSKKDNDYFIMSIRYLTLFFLIDALNELSIIKELLTN